MHFRIGRGDCLTVIDTDRCCHVTRSFSSLVSRTYDPPGNACAGRSFWVLTWAAGRRLPVGRGRCLGQPANRRPRQHRNRKVGRCAQNTRRANRKSNAMNLARLVVCHAATPASPPFRPSVSAMKSGRADIGCIAGVAGRIGYVAFTTRHREYSTGPS